MLRFLPLLIFAALAAMLAYGLAAPKQQPAHNQWVGRPLPAFSLPAPNPAEPPLDSAGLAGKPYLLNAFASWCIPCLIEHRMLMKLADEHHIAIYGIAWHDTPEKIQALFARDGSPYRKVGIDGKGALTVPLGLTGVPESFVIDRRNIIRFKYNGPLDEALVNETILPLLKALEDEK